MDEQCKQILRQWKDEVLGEDAQIFATVETMTTNCDYDEMITIYISEDQKKSFLGDTYATYKNLLSERYDKNHPLFTIIRFVSSGLVMIK